jgi:hypothetical protein
VAEGADAAAVAHGLHIVFLLLVRRVFEFGEVGAGEEKGHVSISGRVLRMQVI